MVFRLSDVFLPSWEEAPGSLPDAEEIEGTVVDFSDSGSLACVFAVVEIVRRQTVIVPIERLRLVGES
ncbi:MAG TPA: hypothetical protein VGS20_08685 [Candidatus Acidoferrales bacterium]|nr:hypothetical protein [Candidatus Acidoferrales bacterium]